MYKKSFDYWRNSMQSNDCGVLNFSAGMVLQPQHFQKMQCMQAAARHLIQTDVADHPLLEWLAFEMQGDALCISDLQVVWQGWVFSLIVENQKITLPDTSIHSEYVRLDLHFETFGWHRGSMDGHFIEEPDWNDAEQVVELHTIWPRWNIRWSALDESKEHTLPLLLVQKDDQQKAGWKITGGFPDYLLHSQSADWSRNFCRELATRLAQIPTDLFGEVSAKIQSEILWSDAAQKRVKWTELWRDFRKLLIVLQIPSPHDMVVASGLVFLSNYWLGEFRALCGTLNTKKISLKSETSAGGKKRWVCVLPPRLLSGDVSALYLQIAFAGEESGEFVISSGKDLDTVLRYGLQGVGYHQTKKGMYEIHRTGEYWLALEQSRELAIVFSGQLQPLADPVLSWEENS